MYQQLTLHRPMRSIFWSTDHSLMKQCLLILSGVMILALASQLSIPLVPVPLTFQSSTVILIGMAYGARYGTYVMATYLVAGLLGLPVFADFSSGTATFFGPTLGYLLGFLPAAWLSGYLAQRGFAKTILRSFVTACLGVSIIFILGIAVLSQTLGLQQAITVGFMPFILSELIKLFAVACVIPRCWKAS
jgi:biotin transport system substrate-specific component